MSTSLLYHAFGIRGYHYMSSRYENGTVIFTTKQPKHSLRCSVCGGRHIIRRGKKVRRLRVVPIGNKPAFVELAVPRVWCLVCGLVRQVKIGFASWRRS